MERFKSTSNIFKDIDDVFTSIKKEIYDSHLSSGNDISYIKNSVCKYVPELIINKNLLLLDTLLNYLTKDARETLESVNNKVINEFYEQNQHLLERLKKEFQNTLRSNIESVNLSPDRRVLYSAGSGALSAGVIGVVGRMALHLSPIVTGFAMVLASSLTGFATYTKTTSMSMAQLEKDVNKYLNESQNLTLQGVNSIISEYKKYFIQFLGERDLNEPLKLVESEPK